MPVSIPFGSTAEGAAEVAAGCTRGRRRATRGLGVGIVAAAVLSSFPAPAPAAVAAPQPHTVQRAAPAAVQVVAFGDSVPAGAACGCVPFPATTAAQLGAVQRRPAGLTRFARGGLRSAHVVAQLKDAAVLRALTASDVAVVQVGANDFDPGVVARCRDRIASCYGPQLRRLRANLTWSLRTIGAAQRNARAEVVVLGYWNVFRDGRVGRAQGRRYVVGSDRLTRAVNAVVAQAAADTGALYADAYRPFKGGGGIDPTPYLAADGDHPNTRGHALLRDAVLRRLGSRAAVV